MLSLLALVGAPGAAHAARPMITDDARIVDPKSCQVEAWTKFLRSGTERWALPGCNPTGNLEITVGGAFSHADVGPDTTHAVVQGKTLFRPMSDGDWGVGLAVGWLRHDSLRTSFNYGEGYVYVPVSRSFADDRFVLHLNAGATHRGGEGGRTVATWGVGSETRLAQDLQLIAEAFGDDRSRPFHQIGLRWWVVPDRVQVDATHGNRFGTETGERWLSVGLRLLSPPFLP